MLKVYEGFMIKGQQREAVIPSNFIIGCSATHSFCINTALDPK